MAHKSSKSGIKLKLKLSEETSEKIKTTANQVSSENELENVENRDSDKIDELIVNTDKIDCEESNSLPDKTISNNTDVQQYGDYTEHIHYEENVAIYTDPATKCQYVWCNTKNEWISRTENQNNPPASDTTDTSEKDDDSNKNVQYGFEDNKHTYTEADGTVYFWDEEKSAWFPKVDDDFLAHYQMAYGFVDNTTKDEDIESKPNKNATEKKLPEKRKPEDPKWFEVSEEQNTKVYVSNLPLDITEEEFVDLMQKCGLVMKDPSTQKMKIKLYTKPNSQQLKGDGLCTYIKVESVELALTILDGYLIRDHKINVQRAKFQMKGEFNPALKPKKRKKDKEKLKKMQEKLFDWRPEKMRGEKSKHERIVIIKNLFEPSLFDNEVHLILEYQQDMREECSKCGVVKKVTLYDRHPEGVAQIVMSEPEEAEKVVALINERWFGKRQLSAAIWDGKTKYKMEETDADLNKRLDVWNQFLEEGTEAKTE